MNALASVPLADHGEELFAFAGSGHMKMATEILRDPDEVTADIESFLIGRGEGRRRGILYRIFDLYERTENEAEKQEILAYATISVGGLFGNVYLRRNHQGMSFADLKNPNVKSLYNLQTAKRDQPPSDSSFLVFTRAMKKLDDGPRAGADPLISAEKSPDAWKFFREVCEQIYRPVNHPRWEFNNVEQYEIGLPVAADLAQEQITLFDCAQVSIERGFVTGVIGLAG
jgi:hypothetical protein